MRKIILPPIVMLIAIVLAKGLATLFPSPWHDCSLKDVGIAIGVLGFVLILWANRAFIQHKTNIMPYKDPETIITTGPFRFSRNPIYLGMLMATIGAAVIVGHLVSALAPIGFFAVVNWYHIPFEESRMQAVFGDAFEEYRSKVRRWI